MKELTEEKSEPNSERTFESMNISVGDIFPPKKKSFFWSWKNKFILFIVISLLIISIIIILGAQLSKSEDNNNICEIGEENKCMQCDESKNKCIKCNLGYKLMNGICILNYSFKAIFYSYRNNETVKLLNNLSASIIEMYVDENKIQPKSFYTFPLSGNHLIHILMNTDNLTSISNLFYKINKLIYISFSHLFNTEKITNMSHLFYGCSSLTSIYIINFKTQNLIDMEYMFSGCSNLESIEYNFNTENAQNMNNMFSYCYKLK